MIIDSGTAAQLVVVGEPGQYMTIPDQVDQARFTWAIDAPDTIPEGTHDVVVRLHDAAGRVWSSRIRYVSAVPAKTHALTVLDGLGGSEAGTTGMNRRGDVTGWALDANGRRRAVAWRAGRIDVLPVPETLGAWGNAINDLGEVAGAVMAADECAIPVLWHAGGMRVISDAPLMSCGQGEAIAINNSSTALVLARGYGYLTGPEGVVTLPFAHPYALNDHGQVVGQGSGLESAYAAGYNIDFTPLTYLPFGVGHVFTAATGVNDREQVIGNSRGRPYIVKAGEPSIDLMPHLGWTSPVALNDSGIVLAFDERSNDAFVWASGRVARVSIPPSEWQVVGVTAINNAGQIAGRARNRTTGRVAAVLLTP
jgi:hypothetical protein